jgi:hypothetical protein
MRLSVGMACSEERAFSYGPLADVETERRLEGQVQIPRGRPPQAACPTRDSSGPLRGAATATRTGSGLRVAAQSLYVSHHDVGRRHHG